MPRAADQIIDLLLQHGISMAFGVPGESYLQLLDAISSRPPFRFIVCRHEGGAAMAAEAYGKTTGMPGLCLVTRGPGATNAASGIHIAFQDSTPLIVVVGQARRPVLGREAFQEIDHEKFFAPLAKWCAELDDAARLPELVSRAIHVAMSGRPGPVVLSLPEDLLSSECMDDFGLLPFRRLAPAPAPADVEVLRRLLDRAEQPLIIAGGGGWTAGASDRLAAFAGRHAIPVAAAFRRQDVLDNEHPHYVGHLSLGTDAPLKSAVRSADLVIALGCRLGEVTTSDYTLLTAPFPHQELVHVHTDPDEIGTVYRPTLGLVSGIEEALAAFEPIKPRPTARRKAWLTELRGAYESHCVPVEDSSTVQLGHVMRDLRAALPDSAVITNGAGNYAIWLHRFFRYRKFGTQLAPTCGSMGYGLPAAIAAALAHPRTPVVCLAGDGCFMMTSQELATAVMHRLKITIILINNGAYGTIRMHQEQMFPGRVVGTSLQNPDFVDYARSFGASAERIHSTESFPAALSRALATDGPALIEIPHDLDAIRPGVRLHLESARDQERRERCP